VGLVNAFVVEPGRDTTPNLAAALAELTAEGQTFERISLPSGLPRRAGKVTKRIAGLFKYTPEPLLESWITAQHLLRRTEPGDVILVSDRGGAGGILAVDEAGKARDDRRRIWTVAGDGLYLRLMLVAGTPNGVEEHGRSEIDWELAQYRFSDQVFATSGAAISLLAELGVDAELVTKAAGAVERPADGAGSGVWAPGPVSRQNRSGDVMRAVASVPGAVLTVSHSDADDEVWSGTTWEALAGVKELLGDRLRRGDRPSATPEFVVVADALNPPDATTAAWRFDGTKMLVVDGSVAAGLWPEAATWQTTDDLAALVRGEVAEVAAPERRVPSVAATGDPSPRRAERVSVGVPVFATVDYLDACVESILAQTVAPHEILLIDDGSASAEVDAALAGWAARHPELVRVLHQPNRGVCVARNRLIEEMTGDAFLLVDQDDLLDPDFIHRTSVALRQDGSLWAVAVWTEFFGEYEGIEAKPPFDRRTAIPENPIVSTAALVDMSVRDKGIAFVPDLAFLFCEDWNYWSQIIAAGGRMGLVPEPLVRHRVHHASGGFQRTVRAHMIGRARAIEPLLGPSN
jgi:GT2 family glycosyltransferase